ncbi:MAG: hypothetical protein NZ958_00825 [Bacteroidia bacterium]|nr:hypothetical protein [Bacteroidia bacterium]
MASVRFLFQSYGSDSAISLQTRYAILSILAHAPPEAAYSVALYTDQPALFPEWWEGLEVHTLQPGQIRAWQGPHHFVHRLKLVLLLHDASHFPAEVRFYLDGDTYFQRGWGDLVALVGPGAAVLHKMEYFIATQATGQMRRFRRRSRPLRYRGAPIPLDIWMWNAGVIGFHSSHVPLLEEAIQFVDEIYPQLRKHYIEQYAVSLFFQRHLRLYSAEPWIVHYWGEKPAYTRAIEAFFQRPLSLGQRLEAIRQGEALQLPQPWWHRWLRF